MIIIVITDALHWFIFLFFFLLLIVHFLDLFSFSLLVATFLNFFFQLITCLGFFSFFLLFFLVQIRVMTQFAPNKIAAILLSGACG